MNDFTINQEVWVYYPGQQPQEGIITEILEWGIRVKTDEDVAGNSIHSQFRIYRRPQEREKLIGQLLDDAADLLRYARKLESEVK